MSQKIKYLETVHLKTKEMLECFGQKNIIPHFILFADKKAGVKERKQLRQELIKQIKNHKDFVKYKKNFDKDNFLQIGEKPDCPFISFSISHCDHLGAFLFTFNWKTSIGFDVEQRQRITEKLVGRISSKKEIQQSPSPSLLWTAKEAGLKCLSNKKNPILLSECFISDWRKEPEKEICFFKCHSTRINKKAFGIARYTTDLALAYAETQLDKISMRNIKATIAKQDQYNKTSCSNKLGFS